MAHPLSAIPSVDNLLRTRQAEGLIAEFGRSAVTAAVRRVLEEIRAQPHAGDLAAQRILSRVEQTVHLDFASSLKPVFNLTGTVLHTNLGRAPLPEEAIREIETAARGPLNFEFDLATGQRGDRDSHLQKLISKLTGAEAATVVNNNAAAVLLVLNTLALRKEVPVSRGELIEIGGSFRMPDIMARSGCRLQEVGTTNRTHLADYESAIGPKTGMVMKVHTSNYSIEGFSATVPETDLADLCRKHKIPFAVDLGSGSLLDLESLGLPHEPTVSETLRNGADIVTFSGDKLLGGPQAGIIAGRAELIGKIKRNPLKRALRVDKLTIAALSAVLRLYLNPEHLVNRLPTLRLLTRSQNEIRASAERLLPNVAAKLKSVAQVTVVDCESQIGSGALPTQTLVSAGLAIQPLGKQARAAAQKLAEAFRKLPIPIIGRMHEGVFFLDLRCLEDEQAFLAQLTSLEL